VQDKLLLNFKDTSSFIVIIYDRTPPDNFYCSMEVINPPQEEKSNENIKEEPSEAIIRYNDSMNIDKVRDRAFRAAHENINSLSDTLNG
jgi:hypothetical protein